MCANGGIFLLIYLVATDVNLARYKDAIQYPIKKGLSAWDRGCRLEDD